jgi:anthranilate synthase component I
VNAPGAAAVVPDAEHFRALAAGGALVPVTLELHEDALTPMGAFLRLDDGRASFLLEGLDAGRLAVTGSRPALAFRAHGDRCALEDTGGARASDGPPLEVLAALLGRRAALALPGLPGFCGGAVGWLGAGARRWWEPDAPAATSDGGPDAVFLFTDVLCAFPADAWPRLVTLAAGGTDPARAWAAAVARLEDERRRLATSPAAPPSAAVAEHRRRRSERDSSTTDALLTIRLGGDALTVLAAGAAVRLRADRVEAHVRLPRSGRGRDEAEDAALGERLLHGEASRARHAAAVDVARADLGWLAEPGTLETPRLFALEQGARSQSLAARVRARAREGLGALDVAAARLGSALDGGSKLAGVLDARGDLELFAATAGPADGAEGRSA